MGSRGQHHKKLWRIGTQRHIQRDWWRSRLLSYADPGAFLCSFFTSAARRISWDS